MSEQRPRTEAELVEFVRSIDVSAPESLHRSVEAMISERSGSRAGSRSRAPGFPGLGRLVAGAALAAAVVAVALAAVLGGGSGGGGGTVTLREAAALTLRPATAAAPAESASNGADLAAAMQGVPFPYWEGRLGWRSTGERVDSVAGRAVRTVFYADPAGRRVGYAIVAGSTPNAGEGPVSWHRGVRFHVTSEHGVEVVSWLRSGHLCVVSGRGVGAATLMALASWGQARTVA